MNDDQMFDYLVAIGQMRPEEAELKKKQAMVDALRKNAMTPQQGQMVSGHYVSPGIAGAISQLGQAYLASRGQEGVDAGVKGLNDRQAQLLDMLRKRRRGMDTGYAGDSTAIGYDTGYDFGGQ